MAKSVLMPDELTAENGAKYIFLGEFSEERTVPCSECHECDEEEVSECEACDGKGEYTLKVPVSWDTIKNIYALAVEKLSVKTKVNETHISVPIEPTEAMIIAAAGEGYSLEDKRLVTKEYKAMLATLNNK